MKKGVSRGIFQMRPDLARDQLHMPVQTRENPVKQGFFGIFEVFVDTIVICTLTALVILCSQVPVSYGQAAGAELTISGFTATYGNWVSVFTAVAMCCFAFPPLSVGDYTGRAASSFCSAPVSISRSCWCMHWLPLWVRPWIWA